MAVTLLQDKLDEEAVGVVHFVGGALEVLVDVDGDEAQVVGMLLHFYQY